MIKCYDVVSMILDEATSQFKPLWKQNDEKRYILKEYCEAIDEIAAEFCGISYDVEVDEISMEICVCLECDEIIIKTKEHRLYDLVERSIKFEISAGENDMQNVKFVFPGIWDRV